MKPETDTRQVAAVQSQQQVRDLLPLDYRRARDAWLRSQEAERVAAYRRGEPAHAITPFQGKE